MNTNTIGLFTTAYPEGQRFFPDFIHSLQNQSDGDFDLWIGLDRILQSVIEPFVCSFQKRVFIEQTPDNSPADLRNRAIEQMVMRYDAIIFVDSDDILVPTRVEAARNMIAHADIGGCALSIINENGESTHHLLQYPENSMIASRIPLCYNVFGLSNTIYTSGILKKILPIPDGCILIDWFLATSGWVQGAQFSFDSIPRMKYRQYATNTARILPPFTPEYILKAAKMVLNHYRFILGSVQNIPFQKQIHIEEQRKTVSRFINQMEYNSEKLTLYVKKLNELPFEHIWWDMIAHPLLDDIWKN